MSIARATTIEKPIRVVEFLTALAKINSKIMRDIDEYRKTLWLHQIPREPKHCFSQAWGEEDEFAGDIWVEVRKFPEPALPKVPDKCRDWANPETLRNIKEIPELRKTILVEEEELNAETGETQTVTVTLSLEAFPDVESAWETYLEERWLPWTELYARYLAVQEVYANLFHIYQEQQKLGEQFELVLGIGLLTWKTPSGHSAKRHLITAKASLEFEPHLGKFTVRPALNGEQVDIELDMLDVSDHPQNARQLIEGGRSALNGRVWDRSAVDPVLNAIANSMADSGQGEYHRDHVKPETIISEKPVVEFSPALILRKRSMRGLELLLEKIKEQIEAGGFIPREFLDLCESLGETQGTELGLQCEREPVGGGEIYFPLLSNEEQRRIIRTLDRQDGVLVQGPPGTGKSHTIVNLICHFLATGKRVLVTAKTHRALQVLHEKLPGEIQPLCINLLGSSTEERESLEKSVAGILMKLDRRDEIHSELRIRQLEKDIQTNRALKAEADNKLRALRESETYRACCKTSNINLALNCKLW
jgi:hypothetical protein